MRKLNNQKGFTFAEILLVLAIMTALSGVGFVAVQNYTRSMAKLEYDAYAREIFIAAQNHLSMAKNLDYLGIGAEGYGTREGESDVYYYVVNVNATCGTPVTQSGTLLRLMLPTAALDETVRLGGKYIIRYHPGEAVVMDVFYWSDSGRYAHQYHDEYSKFLAKRGNRAALKTYETDNAVIGYYGGADAQAMLLDAGALSGLNPPTITVRNAERLTVTVTDTNTDVVKKTMRLIVRGRTSGAEAVLGTADLTPESRVTQNGTQYTFVLDDITRENHRFCKLSTSENTFFPGEEITLCVLAEPEEFRSPAYSATVTANSLFGERSTTGKAEIANIRHLENLNPAVSGVNAAGSSVSYAQAEQTAELSWTDFKVDIGNVNAKVYFTDDDGYSGPTKAGCFLPVTPGGVLSYEGGGHSIREVRVDGSGNTGLFGTLAGTVQTRCAVANLKLIDFSVSGGTNAGALAGSVSNTAVSNVLAYNSGNGTGATISGSDSVGGLIGVASGESIQKSAAALVVTGGSAGGLVGVADGTELIYCYAGGHTKNGAYRVDEIGYNVVGSSYAGGLVGQSRGAITNCYSTCSVTAATAGGLVGKVEGAIKGSYCVGAVSGSVATGLFAGVSSGTCSGCAYLDVGSYDAPDVTQYEAPPAVGSGSSANVTAMDGSLDAYADWTAVNEGSVPYDTTLRGAYPYRSFVPEDCFAHVHYGDWPAVATDLVNQ